MSSYNELALNKKINSCIDQLHQILQCNKTGITLQAAEKVPHRYEDKYLLAEQVTTVLGASVLNVFREMGIQGESLVAMLHWVTEGDDVNLRFERNHRCVFMKETIREEESATQLVTEKSGMFNQKSVTKAVTRIVEYHYTFDCHIRLVAYKGYILKKEGEGEGEEGSDSSSLVLLERRSEQACIVRSKVFPFPEQSKSHYNVKITWLLQLLSQSQGGSTNSSAISFHIDRSRSDCYTPRRNEDVEKALRFVSELSGWAGEVNHYLSQELLTILQSHDHCPEGGGSSRLDGGNLWDVEEVLMPVLPIFQDREEDPGEDGGTVAAITTTSTATKTSVVQGGSLVMIDAEAVEKIVQGQQRSLEGKLQEVMSVLAGNGAKLISGVEGKLIVCLRYVQKLLTSYRDSMEYIEGMLRNQLIAAIGKTISPWDFGEYMKFHYRKILKECYQPRGFSYSIRRSAVHSPEGTVRIEIHNRAEGNSNNSGVSGEQVAAAGNNLLMTSCRDISYAGSDQWTEFSINASTKIRVGGERYVHGWLGHGFSNDAGLPELKLVAETRQFSSYIVLLGRMLGGNQFDAQHAFIVQNKDLVTIPLLLETIPTPKQFRDAIESLSPEQQAFAKAYRGMQLASTLFGMMVIQIKPQLEKVLQLDEDSSLTKEIQLTQDLMKLFIEYQIPSDLVSYDGPVDAVGRVKIERVKELVDEMMGMIKEAKEEEMAEKKREREHAYGRSDMEQSRGAEWAGSGKRVEADYRARGRYFPGQITNSRGDGTFDIDYDDGETETRVQESSVRLIEAGRGGRGSGRGSSKGGAVSSSKKHAQLVEAPAPPLPSHIVVNPPSKQEQMTTTESSQPQKQQDAASPEEAMDVTKLPALLDSRYETFDADNALRPAILHVGNDWEKSSQKSLLSAASMIKLGKEAQAKERNAAFDLLDALTRSGGLTIDHGQLHVVIAGLHCFDQSLMDTLIQKNVNPIERVERSYLLMSSTLQGVEVMGMVKDNQHTRVSEQHAALLSM